jgi:hypothetical protein
LKLKYGVKEKGLMKSGEECGEAEVELREGDGGLELFVDLELPEGTKPSPRAPSAWTLTLPGILPSHPLLFISPRKQFY